MVTKPTYWLSGRWVTRETATLPGGMKLSELPAWAAGQGIPADAEFEVERDYGALNVALTWLVPEEEEKEEGVRP